MNKISHTLTTEETTFIADVQNIVYAAKKQAFNTVNTMMVVSNWLVGQRIVLQEQKGNDRAEYGKRVIAIASEELTKLSEKDIVKRHLETTVNFTCNSLECKFSNHCLLNLQTERSQSGNRCLPNLKM